MGTSDAGDTCCKEEPRRGTAGDGPSRTACQASISESELLLHYAGVIRVGVVQKQEFGGVLALMGSVDTANRPVLMVSHTDDNLVRLYDLPSFADRGHLPGVSQGRALAAAGRILISGDQKGIVKMWQWKTEAMPLN